MKLILATLFAFLALSMGFRSRLNNNMFMENTLESSCSALQDQFCFLFPGFSEDRWCFGNNFKSLCETCTDSDCAKYFNRVS
jgi:hypothetical protein